MKNKLGSIIIALFLCLLSTTISIAQYNKLEITAIPFSMELRSSFKTSKSLLDETNMSIKIKKEYLTDSRFLNEAINSLEVSNNSNSVDIRLVLLLYNKSKVDTLSIFHNGNIKLNNNFYKKNKNILQYLINYLPCKYIDDMQEYLQFKNE